MTETTKVDRSVTRMMHLKDSDDDGYVEGDPATRISLVWEITQDTWAFMKEGNAQRRLQRDVTHLIRRTR
jgi:hypothetical protein